MMNRAPVYTQGPQTPFLTESNYNSGDEHWTWAQVHRQTHMHNQYGARERYPITTISNPSVSMSIPAPAHHSPFNTMQSADAMDPAVFGQTVAFPFSGKVAKNRVLKSAMSERLATFSPCDPRERGQPTEELIRLYETWATGGMGTPRPTDLWLYDAQRK